MIIEEQISIDINMYINFSISRLTRYASDWLNDLDSDSVNLISSGSLASQTFRWIWSRESSPFPPDMLIWNTDSFTTLESDPDWFQQHPYHIWDLVVLIVMRSKSKMIFWSQPEIKTMWNQFAMNMRNSGKIIRCHVVSLTAKKHTVSTYRQMSDLSDADHGFKFPWTVYATYARCLCWVCYRVALKSCCTKWSVPVQDKDISISQVNSNHWHEDSWTFLWPRWSIASSLWEAFPVRTICILW